jgi:thioredoxin 1
MADITPTPPPGGALRVYAPLMFVVGGILLMLLFVMWVQPTRKLPDSGDVMALTSANWDREVLESKVPVLIDFWAPWCGPCREFSPIVQRVAKRYDGKVKVAKVDIDEARDLAERFGIRSIPTVLLFDGGTQPRWRQEGMVPEGILTDALENVLNGKT